MSEHVDLEVLKAVIREVLDERTLSCSACANQERCCQFCSLTPQEHVEHHKAISLVGAAQLAAHHQSFQAAINDRREVKRWIFRVIIGMITLSTSTFIGAAIWHYFKDKLFKGGT